MKTIIEMAREAGLPEAWISDIGVLKWSDLARFAEIVRADEREACAKVTEIALLGADLNLSRRVLKAIRARGNT